jgi:hypothetical protein
VNKDEFWKMIDASIDATRDMYQEERLHSILSEYEREEIADFERHFEHLRAISDRGDIWAAAMSLNGGYCSDNGFLYFRSWLISRGKDVFLAAVNNPNSLANVDIELSEDGHPSASFEEFGYVGFDVYENKTNGGDLYEDYQDSDIPVPDDWDWSDFYDDNWLSGNLPKLWNRFGKFKIESDRMDEENVNLSYSYAEIPTIAHIEIGSTIYHRKHGRGIITHITKLDDSVTATIEFEDEVRPMLLMHPEVDNAELYSLNPFEGDA